METPIYPILDFIKGYDKKEYPVITNSDIS